MYSYVFLNFLRKAYITFGLRKIAVCSSRSISQKVGGEKDE